MNEFARNIQNRLNTDTFRSIYVYDEVSSTMDTAKEYSAESPDKSVFIALRQTDGQGTTGRSFSSEEGGLYMSILFKDDDILSDNSLLTVKLACAVTDALKTISGGHTDIKVKWVNDVYMGGKKIAGILTRGTFTANRPEYIVAGIGININNESFGKSLSEKATSLHLVTGKKYPLSEVAACVLDFVHKYLSEMADSEILRIYEDNCITVGSEIKYFCGEDIVTANVTGITPEGFLVAQNGPDKQIIRSASEIYKGDDF